MTNFFSGTNSCTTPVDQYSCPSGPCIQFRYLPPCRACMLLYGQVNPSGPHHFLNVSGTVKASQTFLAGKLNTRWTTTSLWTAVSCDFDVFLAICIDFRMNKFNYCMTKQ